MQLETNRLKIKTTTKDDLPQLSAIYLQACSYFSFDETHPVTAPLECFESGDLPPNGIKENFEMLSIFENAELIGYITYYKGYPNIKTVYLCFIFLNKRKYGYGTEIINSLIDLFIQNGFDTMKLGVSLKNTNGLAFWHKCGFNKISLVDIDEHYSCLELEKDLL